MHFGRNRSYRDARTKFDWSSASHQHAMQATTVELGERAAARTIPIVVARSYLSDEVFRAEAQRVWPHTWQLAGREEELKAAGDYLSYEINDESVIVVRTAQGLRAYHNVCPHRGRRIVEGCGHTARLHCRFHNWQWDLEGRNTQLPDRAEWCDTLSDEDVALKPVQVDTWAGFIFIHFQPEPEPLLSYLGAVVDKLKPYKLEEMRYKTYRQITFPCNWKVALEAFNEGYHVQGTHRQLLDYNDDRTVSAALGRHSFFGYPVRTGLGQGSPRLGKPLREDVRQAVVDYYLMMIRDLDAMFTQREAAEIQRLPAEVPPGASLRDVMLAYRRLQMEAAEKSGVSYPALTNEELTAAGGSFHIFPNMVVLPMPMALLGYRVRPNGSPDSCIFEVFALERWAPGQEPAWEKRICNDPQNIDFWGLILTQDFSNMAAVQKGMKSSAFAHSQPNPTQEAAVLNFHRQLAALIDGRPA
jgi:phenylpropionate dioxygenase-like ring-hydroxylating dioxygenase large terminal subunit